MFKVDVYSGAFPHAMGNLAQSYIETFKQYKREHKFWAFGRDAPYHDPASALHYGLKHVHIIARADYYTHEYKKTILYNRTSDKHLVYAVNPDDPNHFLLIAVLSEPAHIKARDMKFMRDLIDIVKAHFKLN